MALTVRIYRSLAGSYLALLVGPAVPALAAVAGITGYRWPLFSVGALVIGGVGYLVTADVDVVRWLTTTWVAVIVTVLPLCYLVWLIALLAHNPGKVLLTILGRPSTAGVFAFAIGLTAVVLANRQATVERIEQATVYASFTAGPTPRRRRLRYGTFAVGLGAVAGLLGVLSIHGAVSSAVLVAGLLLVPLSIVGLHSTQQRSIVVTDEGIAIDGTFTEWLQFESYEVTDRSLVLQFRSHWLDDMHLDVAEIGALDAVRAALDDHVQDGPD